MLSFPSPTLPPCPSPPLPLPSNSSHSCPFQPFPTLPALPTLLPRDKTPEEEDLEKEVEALRTQLEGMKELQSGEEDTLRELEADLDAKEKSLYKLQVGRQGAGLLEALGPFMGPGIPFAELYLHECVDPAVVCAAACCVASSGCDAHVRGTPSPWSATTTIRSTSLTAP